MLARLWFALSLLWAAVMLLAMCNPNANESGREWLLGFALAPFVFGLLVRKVSRYVIIGRL